MTQVTTPRQHSPHRHSHVFLGTGHEQSERQTWIVILLCGAMMVAEIVGGELGTREATDDGPDDPPLPLFAHG